MYRPSTLAVVALGVAALTAPPLHAQLGDLVKQKAQRCVLKRKRFKKRR